jgi:uncharacterized protein (TIGR03083 family)
VDHARRLAAIEDHGRRLIDAARVGLDAPVRACGSWRVADLLWHLCEVYRFWTSVAESPSSNRPDVDRKPRPSDIDVLTWAEQELQSLIAALGASPMDRKCWTWAGEQNFEWLTRRMAHETIVHCWDVTWAAGLRPEIDADLASDGIDEFLHVMTPLVREGQPVVGGSVHVHCTDVEGEWLAVPSDGLAMTVTREHAKGSVALRGPASDLYLVLWRRVPVDLIEVIGDAAVADRFLSRADLD